MFNKSEIMKRAHQSAHMRNELGNVFGKTTYAKEFAKALKEQWAMEKMFVESSKRREAERKAALEAKKVAPAPQPEPTPVSRGWTVSELAQLMTDGPVREEHYAMARQQLAA